MAWVTPRTWVLSELVDPAKMNTLKSNLDELWKYTTAGDILYANTSTSLTPVAIGSEGQVLRVSSGVPTWVTLGSQTYPFQDGNRTNTSWDGDSKSVDTYVINAHSFNADIPTNATGIFVSVSAKWTTLNAANELDIRTNGVSGNGVHVRSLVANYFMDNSGYVPLNASGEFQVVINNASAEVYLDIWGYTAP